jgi:RsiW-degrading membrane proteinase PrsW (M82 family)
MEKSRGNEVAIRFHRPALREKLFFIASGILGSVPLTLFIDQFDENFLANLPQFYATLIPVVIVAPFVEEFAKAFPLFYRHGETVRSIFVLGFLTGLGFGIFEFFIYVLELGAPIIFRWSGILFHASSTSITSYGIATKRTAPFYFVAVLLHAFNNFFAFIPYALGSSASIGPWSIGLMSAAAAAYFLSWRLYDKTSERIVE